MAMPVGSTSTFVSIGNREDLSDEIYRITPTKVPFFSMADREKATSVLHEWQTQDLAANTATNIQLEGDDATLDSPTTTTRLNNYCTISRKVPGVTGTQEAVDHAGRDSEMAFQVSAKMLELKRDVETILVGANSAKNSGSSTVGRVTASILSWLKTNANLNSTSGNPAAADGTGLRTDAATTHAFQESYLKAVLKSCYDQGGEPNVIMTGSFNKQQFSTFVGRSSPIEQASTKKITASVDAYESDFGTLKVVPNRFQRTRDVLVLQDDMWAIAWLRPVTSFDLAKTGDSIRKEILGEYALVSRNEKSSGIIADLTSA